MKKSTSFTYTVSDLKKNLAIYHADIFDRSVMEAIKKTILDSNCNPKMSDIQLHLEDAGMCKVDFDSTPDIIRAIEEIAPVIVPEVQHLLEDKEVFTVTVTDDNGNFLAQIPHHKIQY